MEGRFQDIKHDVKQYHTSITLNLREAYKIVKENITRTANQAKIIWDGKINKSHMHYVSGDKVLFYYKEPHREEGSAPHSQKWNRQWLGPYVIVKQAHDNNTDVYIIKDAVTNREWSVNVNKLRPYHQRNFLGEDMNELPSGESLQGSVGRPGPSQSNTSKLVRLPLKPGNSNISESHRSSVRHATGRSVKESQLANQRAKADINPIPEDAEDLREYELDAILSHKRKGKGYMYLVS
jgi:hypothetical protein